MQIIVSSVQVTKWAETTFQIFEIETFWLLISHAISSFHQIKGQSYLIEILGSGISVVLFTLQWVRHFLFSNAQMFF